MLWEKWSKPKQAPVAVFWDYDNCPVPLGVDTRSFVSSLRLVSAAHGLPVIFRVYGTPAVMAPRARELRDCGVELIRALPGKDIAEKQIYVDVMEFLLDGRDGTYGSYAVSGVENLDPRQSCVVLISKGTGYYPLLLALENRAVKKIVITSLSRRWSIAGVGMQAAQQLVYMADVVYDWNSLG
ncbi:hypothetical protein CLOM_g23749 [Closterium sp. NIES-68]|nr:hypothetical protein CLOM_g23749 [Closterium sp. NIES-68]